MPGALDALAQAELYGEFDLEQLEEECRTGNWGLEADPEFVSTLAYVVEKYAKRLATDLPAFAKHGKRSVAGAEDVLLVARDNPDLLRRLTEFVDFHDHRGKPAARKKKKDADPADAMPGLR